MAIATIESDGPSQSWHDFRDAVIRVSKITGSGPIVVLSSIEQKPDRNIRKACQAQFSDSGLNKLTSEYKAIASIICERPVFLRSKLTQSTIEEMGLGFLKTTDDFLNLVQKHSSAVLLRDAHRVVVRGSA